MRPNREARRSICLQELFRSQYFCQKRRDAALFDLAEPIPGPSTEVLCKDRALTAAS